VASLKAQKIHQHLAREGWESTLNTFPREMTVAVFWIRSPLLSTYTTLFSLPNYSMVRRDTEAASATQCIRVLLIEPDPMSRRSLAHWLNQLPGYRCETTVGSLAEAIQLGASATFELILFNRVLHEASLENSLRQLAKVWVETPAFPFGVYASSDELFVGITGVGSGYFLRRRAPTQLLEPLGNPRPGHRWTATKSETAARAYFLGLLSTTPQSEEASDIPLTHREREMLEFLSRGFQDKEIAAALGISVWTVHTHMKRTFEKLGVHNRAEAVSRYLQK
jgi:DNA-binding NarL/FixJ family response regulator